MPRKSKSTTTQPPAETDPLHNNDAPCCQALVRLAGRLEGCDEADDFAAGARHFVLSEIKDTLETQSAGGKKKKKKKKKKGGGGATTGGEPQSANKTTESINNLQSTPVDRLLYPYLTQHLAGAAALHPPSDALPPFEAFLQQLPLCRISETTFRQAILSVECLECRARLDQWFLHQTSVRLRPDNATVSSDGDYLPLVEEGRYATDPQSLAFVYQSDGYWTLARGDQTIPLADVHYLFVHQLILRGLSPTYLVEHHNLTEVELSDDMVELVEAKAYEWAQSMDEWAITVHTAVDDVGQVQNSRKNTVIDAAGAAKLGQINDALAAVWEDIGRQWLIKATEAYQVICKFRLDKDLKRGLETSWKLFWTCAAAMATSLNRLHQECHRLAQSDTRFTDFMMSPDMRRAYANHLSNVCDALVNLIGGMKRALESVTANDFYGTRRTTSFPHRLYVLLEYYMAVARANGWMAVKSQLSLDHSCNDCVYVFWHLLRFQYEETPQQFWEEKRGLQAKFSDMLARSHENWQHVCVTAEQELGACPSVMSNWTEVEDVVSAPAVDSPESLFEFQQIALSAMTKLTSSWCSVREVYNLDMFPAVRTDVIPFDVNKLIFGQQDNLGIVHGRCRSGTPDTRATSMLVALYFEWLVDQWPVWKAKLAEEALLREMEEESEAKSSPPKAGKGRKKKNGVPPPKPRTGSEKVSPRLVDAATEVPSAKEAVAPTPDTDSDSDSESSFEKAAVFFKSSNAAAKSNKPKQQPKSAAEPKAASLSEPSRHEKEPETQTKATSKGKKAAKNKKGGASADSSKNGHKTAVGAPQTLSTAITDKSKASGKNQTPKLSLKQEDAVVVSPESPVSTEAAAKVFDYAAFDESLGVGVQKRKGYAAAHIFFMKRLENILSGENVTIL